MVEKEKIDLGALQAQLDRAQSAYDDAEQAANGARSRETEALNKLNAAQKALDKAIEQIRENPSWNSEWRNQIARKKREFAA